MHCIAGAGYVGSRLLVRLPAPVRVLTHSEGAQRHWAGLNVESILADFDGPLAAAAHPCAGVDCLFYFVPPPPQGCVDTRMMAFLDWIAPAPPRRIVYISTTGVYGDQGGGWVDESAPLNPQTDRARRRCSAESRLQAFARGRACELIILRVPGIYGPERLPLQKLQSGEPVICPEEAPYTNRIHVDDLVAACLAAITEGVSGHAYNITDDQPSTMTAYFYAVADAAGLPRPRCITLAEARTSLSRAMLSYLGESRRLRNERMKTELNLRLQYPDLASGLAAMYASM